MIKIKTNNTFQHRITEKENNNVIQKKNKDKIKFFYIYIKFSKDIKFKYKTTISIKFYKIIIIQFFNVFCLLKIVEERK